MASKCSERSRLWERAYPDALMKREQALLERRHRDGRDASHAPHAKETSCERHARVGVALSGGGIRSATFGFGVIQALAKLEESSEPGETEGREKLRTLEKIDVLSTVSGGGYTGSLISRLFARDEVENADEVARAILPARESRDAAGSEPKDSGRSIYPGEVLRWLRNNGRYIAPNGSGDLLLGGAIIVRNWISIHVILLTLVLAVFVALQVVRNALHPVSPDGLVPALLTCDAGVWSNGLPSLAVLEAWLSCRLPLGEAYLWWSPWLLLPALIFVVAVVPFAWAYWLAAEHDKYRSFLWPIYWLWDWLAKRRGGKCAVKSCFLWPINPLWGWLFIVLIALLLMLAPFCTKDAQGIVCAPSGAVAGGAVAGGAVFVAGIITLVIFDYIKQISRIRGANGRRDDSGLRSIFDYIKQIFRFRGANGRRDDSELRHWLSSNLKWMLVWFGAALALAVIDSLGQTVYAMWQSPDSSLGAWLGALLGGLVAAAAGGRRLAAYFSGKAGGTRVRPTLNQAATIAAGLLLIVTLTAINALSHGIAWGFEHPHYVPKKLVAPPVASVEDSLDGIRARMEKSSSPVRDIANQTGAAAIRACAPGASPCPDPASLEKFRFQCADCAKPGERAHQDTAAAFGFLLVLSMLFGRSWPFLNNSTLLPLYTARLVRAYLGASNPKRIGAAGDNNGSAPGTVTRVMECDDMQIRERWWSNDTRRNENDTSQDDPCAKDPFAKGAPLHLVNVTINESLDGKSRVQQNDRRGIGMAVGPAGISAGVRHHVVFSESTSSEHEPTATVPEDPTLDGSEDDGSAGRRFRMFDYEPVTSSPEERRVRYGGRHLSLGQWAGISGAAFSTGIGSRTSLGLSFIAGFFNVRLGFWWDSGVDPAKRGRATRSRLGKWFTCALPVQSYLLDEFFARFHGTARRWWHLSDGGHFENTGAYELIRRRLPLIVIIDAGADPDYAYEDLANLIRKARIDFDAEIEFLDHEALRALRACQEGERLGSLEYFGTLEMLRRGPWDEDPIPSTDGTTPATQPVFGPPDRSRRSLAHAALAWVRYEGRPEPDSLIVCIKPTLVGDEPPDITHYQTANQDFPQQTTTDQFFDEAQWESYRKLGQLITERVFPKGFAPYLDLRDRPPPGNAESAG